MSNFNNKYSSVYKYLKPKFSFEKQFNASLPFTSPIWIQQQNLLPLITSSNDLWNQIKKDKPMDPTSITEKGDFKPFNDTLKSLDLSSLDLSTMRKKTGTPPLIKGQAKINNLNSDYGGLFGAGKSVSDSFYTALVGNETTGKTSEITNNIVGIGDDMASMFNPMGGMINSFGKTAGNIIGGTKDRVSGTGSAVTSAISTGLSFAGPIGMAAGFALNFLNGISGGRAMKLADQSDQFGSGYSSSKSYVHNTVGKYSNKKAGLFDFGFRGKANRKLREAQRQQGLIMNIQDYDKKMDSNISGNYLAMNAMMQQSGYTPQLSLGKHGLKLSELTESRKIAKRIVTKQPEKLEKKKLTLSDLYEIYKVNPSDELAIEAGKLICSYLQDNSTQKFQLGGKMNLLPEGALHARKHHITDENEELEGQITKKGIPVISESNGEIIQHAEIECNEWVLRKELTDKIEALYKEYNTTPSDKLAIEAGKLICYELLKNTDDRSGLIKTVK